MRSVAVIAEFNPFHNGHAYLLHRIREELGADTAVSAIMSGWFVQRGDIAVADPYVRAECALRAGFDLVLELPFPYSASSAEYFSGAGVSLADALGCFDTLAFGSECGAIEPLMRIADVADSPNYADAMRLARESEDGKRRGYADLSRAVMSSMLSNEDKPLINQPNNTLAIEYLRALRRLSSGLTPFSVKRIGSGYHEETPIDAKYVGATAIRPLLHSQKTEEIKRYISAEALNPLLDALSRGEAPALLSRLSDAILAFFIAPSDPLSVGTDEASRRLRAAAMDALDLDDLLRRISARSLTDSHVRRTLLHAYLGVTSSELREPPRYTRVLGFNDRGRNLLRVAKRKGSVAILTKTADYSALPPDAARQAERSLGADRIAALALPSRRPASDAYRGVPCHVRSDRTE